MADRTRTESSSGIPPSLNDSDSDIEIDSAFLTPGAAALASSSRPIHGNLIRDRLERLEWVSNNGLRVKRRSSHSITLAWSTESPGTAGPTGFYVSATQLDVPAYPSASHIPERERQSQSRGGVAGLASSMALTNITASSAIEPALPDEGGESIHQSGPCYELQMKRSRSGEEGWETVYKGYGTNVEIKNLRPDTNLTFRLKTDQEEEWGSQIVAATDMAPPTADELQRAVDCNALGMVLRILSTCKGIRSLSIVNSLDRKGQSPLMLSATNGNSDMMSVLLNAGANPDMQAQNTGKTALMVSVGNGDLECVRLLLARGTDVLAQDKSGANAIHYGVISGFVNILQLLLETAPEAIDKVDFGGWTPLLRAVAGGSSFNIIRMLLFHGANPNVQDNANSKSCLMIAASKTDYEAVKIVQALLAYNANPTYRNTNGMSPLEMAKASGLPEVVKLLTAACETWTPDRAPNPALYALDTDGSQPKTLTTVFDSTSRQSFWSGSQTLGEVKNSGAAREKRLSGIGKIQDQFSRASTKSSSSKAKEVLKGGKPQDTTQPLVQVSQDYQKTSTSAVETISLLPPTGIDSASSSITGFHTFAPSHGPEEVAALEPDTATVKVEDVGAKSKNASKSSPESSPSISGNKAGSRRGSKNNNSAKLRGSASPSIDHPMPNVDNVKSKIGSFRTKSKRRFKKSSSSEVQASTEDESISGSVEPNKTDHEDAVAGPSPGTKSSGKANGVGRK